MNLFGACRLAGVCLPDCKLCPLIEIPRRPAQERIAALTHELKVIEQLTLFEVPMSHNV